MKNEQLEKISTDLIAFNALKEKAVTLGTKCKAIIVNSPETRTMAMQTLSEAKDIVNFIEGRRKAIKAPVLDLGKQIDIKAAELTSLVNPGFLIGKEAIKVY